MQNTVRLILIVFLLVLILFNYNSIRILNLSIQLLQQQAEQRASLVSNLLADELEKKYPPLQNLQAFLQSKLQSYKVEGITLYDKGQPATSVWKSARNENPALLLKEPNKLFRYGPAFREGRYLFVQGKFRQGGRRNDVVVVSDIGNIVGIERSTKVITYSNFLLIGFGAFVAFYFFESSFRSYRTLLQTARSAPAESSPSTSNRNDADFLIATFKGVIAKLKEKEVELAKLHLSEKARADDVQQLNQDLIRSISSGLILIDHSKKIRVFNHAAESILGLSRVAVLTYPYSLVMEKISPSFKEDIDRCLAQKLNINRAELEVLNRENEVRYLGASIMPLQDRQQNFAGVICLFSDITDFKLLQEHMAQKEKFASLGEMAAGVAHEFRNSIATIAGYVQLLDNKIETDQKKYTGPVQRELESLQKIVSDFLSFARPVELQMQEVPLENLVRECVQEIRVTLPPQGFEITMDGTYRNVMGDEMMLRQVFLNLIRNAVESMDGKRDLGKVNITASISANGKFTVIDIRDNGAGIPTENLTKIFTPFFSTKQSGAGLGLAIVQKLVLQHNGTIGVDSTAEGTLFRIQLPIE
jgi:PAS domain S-box-containing protein